MDEKEKDPLDPDNDLEICEEMEKNFAKIVSELVRDRSLDRFRKEYEMLHTALTQSHEHNKVLIEKCRALNQDIVANANKISSVLYFRKTINEQLQDFVENLNVHGFLFKIRKNVKAIAKK